MDPSAKCIQKVYARLSTSPWLSLFGSRVRAVPSNLSARYSRIAPDSLTVTVGPSVITGDLPNGETLSNSTGARPLILMYCFTSYGTPRVSNSQMTRCERESWRWCTTILSVGAVACAPVAVVVVAGVLIFVWVCLFV